MISPNKCPKCEELDCIERTVVASELSDKLDKHKKEWLCTKCNYSFNNDEATFWYDERDLSEMKISQIADIIFNDWGDISSYARPYVDVMKNLDSISDHYESESAVMVVSYFLANARLWKGETATRVKKYLKKLAGDYRKTIEVE